MKRMFESFDQIIPPPSDETYDSAKDEPIAWYEPQEDEQFEDKGSKLACKAGVFKLASDKQSCYLFYAALGHHLCKKEISNHDRRGTYCITSAYSDPLDFNRISNVQNQKNPSKIRLLLGELKTCKCKAKSF